MVAFGIVAADFDGDGDEDVMLTSGHVHYHPNSGDIRQPPVLLEHVSSDVFQAACRRANISNVATWDAVWRVADLDNDGDLDAVVTDLFARPEIMENLHGSRNSWLRLRLIGRESPRTPLGAIVTVTQGEPTDVATTLRRWQLFVAEPARTVFRLGDRRPGGRRSAVAAGR